MGNTFATLRTQVGIAKEATKGTPVAATAFIPVKKFDFAPKQTKALDQGWRGSMGEWYGQQNTTRSGEVSLSGDVFCDSIGYLLGGILGDYATTGTGPFAHKFALLNSGDGQPTAYTFTDNQGGIQARQYPGSQISEVTLKYEPAGLLTYDAKALSWVGATSVTPAATFGTLVPVPTWQVVVNFGGVAQTNIVSGEISLKRQNAEAIFAAGAQDPYSIHVGGIEVTTKLTFVAKDESPVVDFLNNAEVSKVMTATFTQAAGQSLAFQMSAMHYDDAKLTRGKSYVEIETTGKAMLNTTDVGGSAGLSPTLITLTNAVTTGTYA